MGPKAGGNRPISSEEMQMRRMGAIESRGADGAHASLGGPQGARDVFGISLSGGANRLSVDEAAPKR